MIKNLDQVPKELIFILAKIPGHRSLMRFLRFRCHQLNHAQIMGVESAFDLIIISVWLSVLVLDSFLYQKPFHALFILTLSKFQICQIFNSE
jgi:hypothetical protein